ncbi:hypothetical protein [Bordetella genomosp. 7]|uniref:Uncharacterized protein n=1 Tax=Bordetella genomosp. 7 TaxID=1416805 RepID=A0A261QYW1_9BORD|nr:hypothetical protein [Bordetella genomosp. 7]OZI17965.1 hypothetical protein CAL19_12865 [Bordetella genomosp. 7]
MTNTAHEDQFLPHPDDVAQASAEAMNGAARQIAALAAQPAASAHPIPQPLRDTFSAIEDSAPSANGMQVFTQMRTAVQSFFQAQPAASAEPGDEEAVKAHMALVSDYGSAKNLQGEYLESGDHDSFVRITEDAVARYCAIQSSARALLSRYGRPAGDAQHYEAALRQIGDYAHDHSTGPAVPDALWAVRSLAYDALSDAPVAAQKADDGEA